jgi:hypothetical protein
MKLEGLLYRLELEADKRADKNWKQIRVDLVKRQAEKPPTVTEACRKSTRDLKFKTEEIWNELRERKMLELAEERHTRARLALLEANRGPAERKAKAKRCVSSRYAYRVSPLQSSTLAGEHRRIQTQNSIGSKWVVPPVQKRNGKTR